MTHYKLLGVHHGATKQDLDTARRKLALQHHPDHGGDGAAMAEINVAYDILVDQKKEKLYRATLAGTHCTCKPCGGTGRVAKQKGFKARTITACTICHGAGLVPKPSKEKSK